ncbi:hypothetical protein NX059_006191 [Plenodomus lindquistii]|nr:hypothetical protein NX059_006191 [Plenodomus lindquistii]
MTGAPPAYTLIDDSDGMYGGGGTSNRNNFVRDVYHGLNLFDNVILHNVVSGSLQVLKLSLADRHHDEQYKCSTLINAECPAPKWLVNIDTARNWTWDSSRIAYSRQRRTVPSPPTFQKDKTQRAAA